jgi:hypothetical protein
MLCMLPMQLRLRNAIAGQLASGYVQVMQILYIITYICTLLSGGDSAWWW